MTRPDGSVVLPGVPWQELARRYEVALRKCLDAMAMQEKREAGVFHLSAESAQEIWNNAKWWAESSLAPAPSATTAETTRCATCHHNEATHLAETHGGARWCDASGCRCENFVPAVPPSSAGEATADGYWDGFADAHAATYATVSDLRTQLATARAEVERLTRSLEAGLSPLDRHCADFLADEVAALVRRKVIDSRSPAADALLDYRNPPSSPRADRLAQLEAERDELRERVRELESKARRYVDTWSANTEQSDAFNALAAALTPPAPSDSDGEKGGGK